MAESQPPERPAPTKEQFLQMRERLSSLTTTDPAAAVAEAKALPADDRNWRLLRASVLCDAGERAKDAAAVDEAIAIFSELRADASDKGRLTYNLANAVASRAQLDEPKGPDWYLRTAGERRRARALYGEAAVSLQDQDLRLASQAMTNLGNSLDTAYRWIEAFDRYQAALNLFPQNGVAAGCASRVLGRVASTGLLGHRPHLLDVASRLADHAKRHREVVAELAGSDAVATFEKLASPPGGLATASLRPDATEYERFVAEHRLLLSPILEGLGHDPERWDDAHIATLTESVGTGATVPPIFAMFNVMKADYLVARELLFQGFQDLDGRGAAAPDSGLYFDTLDYALYGVTPSRLVLAQRAALDLLDKIAVALNEHLAVGLKAQEVTFHKFWRLKPNEPTWRPALAEAIRGGNNALIALSEIAADLTDGSQDGSLPGLLHAEKRTRHAGTHRFVVVHDFMMGDSRPSEAIEHLPLETFRETVLRTVRLARAALLHFLETIGYSECAKPRDGKFVGEMLVRPHHVIRGDD
jgi:tetratricopeptide (TPR) repeat protein